MDQVDPNLYSSISTQVFLQSPYVYFSFYGEIMGTVSIAALMWRTVPMPLARMSHSELSLVCQALIRMGVRQCERA